MLDGTCKIQYYWLNSNRTLVLQAAMHFWLWLKEVAKERINLSLSLTKKLPQSKSNHSTRSSHRLSTTSVLFCFQLRYKSMPFSRNKAAKKQTNNVSKRFNNTLKCFHKCFNILYNGQTICLLCCKKINYSSVFFFFASPKQIFHHQQNKTCE